MWLGIHRSDKFAYLFQVGMGMHAQNDWKQQVSYISKMDLCLNLIPIWWGIHKSINMIQSINMGVVKCNRIHQK